MRSFIREDDIEQAICNRLSLPEYGWKRIECDARGEAQDEVLSTGRANPSECILCVPRCIEATEPTGGRGCAEKYLARFPQGLYSYGYGGYQL